MDLTAGSRLGPYEVLSPLGSGGMGEVYRARDPRLGRDVAIKVLPAQRMSEERRQRFLREARAASALNHPNIVTIHEIGVAEGRDFIVMEYVAGRRLDQLIARQGMPLGEMLRIAIPIADALARAHERGIVHRDLKPANVLVGSEGAVKLVDFGLAKLVDSGATNGASETDTYETLPGELSRPGRISGTLGYMSPEQATGAELDARSDIFSFGVLLYEMVAGRRPFAEETASATLAAVTREEPLAPSLLAPHVPRDLERVVLRCLRKEVDRRYQSMTDVRLDLEQIKEDSDSQQQAKVSLDPRRWRGRPLLVALTVVLALSVAAWRVGRDRGSPLPPPQLLPLTTLHGWEWEPTFSPDGEQVAFKWDGEKGGNDDIYVTMLGSSAVHRLTTDPAPDGNPSWSPDGRQIAFVRTWAENWDRVSGTAGIHLVSPLGGTERRLGSFPVAGWGPISWSADSRWLAASRRPSSGRDGPAIPGIYLVPVSGGEPRLLTRPEPRGADTSPAFSPDGRRLAYASCPRGVFGGGCDVHVLELDAGLRPAGPPRRLTWQAVSIPYVAWTRDGRSLVYCANEGPYLFHLWRVGLHGDRPPERIELAGSRAWGVATAHSRDRLAFVETLREVDIHRFWRERPSEAFLASSFFEGLPRFSPDGERIAFASTRSGDNMEIWLAAADGSGPVQLTHGPGRYQGPPSWSPEGRRIAFASLGEDGLCRIWTIDVEGGVPSRLTGEALGMSSWSRDGHWVYFDAGRDGAREIWRVPAMGGTEERVTWGGAGGGATESVDGRTLYYKRAGGDSPLVALPLAGGAERELAACVRGSGSFDVVASGIYYPDCRAGDPALHRLDPVSGRDEVLGPLEKWDRFSGLMIAVSPDGRTILYPKLVREGSDLMLIEGFR